MIEQLRSEYGDNYSYVIYDEESSEAALVDPVVPDQIRRFLSEKSLKPHYLINTHGHGDHTNGNKEFQRLSGVELIAHSKASSRIGNVDRTVTDGEVLRVAGHRVKVLHTPGHTSGSICLLTEEHLISGDTVFMAGCGNPTFGGNTRELFRSIKDKLLGLPDHLILYPGHDYARKNLKFALECEPDNRAIQEKIDYVRGVKLEGEEPVSTLGEEKKFNPFFRFKEEQLRNNLKGLSGAPTDWSVFKRLRELRNRW